MLISELEDKDKNLDEIMQQLGKDAKKSSQILAKADTNIKNNAIKKSSEIIKNFGIFPKNLPFLPDFRVILPDF